MPAISRRRFLCISAAAIGSVYTSTAFSGQQNSRHNNKTKPLRRSQLGRASFLHGVASGDPLTDSVILWTRATPSSTKQSKVKIQWRVFEKCRGRRPKRVASGVGFARKEHDYTLKVDIKNLKPGTEYIYYFRSKRSRTCIGKTRTLPEGSAEKLKLAVVSCSNFPAGYFHVYHQLAKIPDLDIALHLGDYIYEYGRGGYASSQAAALGREVVPSGELLTLNDYRKRYAQYRSDSDLQLAHATVPFIVVWDDHEVANDAWRDGAENHNAGTQGDYETRRTAALQAYFEWLPIRPAQTAENSNLTEPSSIYRQFQWGDLANLLMLDTRHENRDQALSYSQFTAPDTGQLDFAAALAAINDESRQLMGEEQLDWLQHTMAASNATWQILGQQILMGNMSLPAAVATQALSIGEFAELAQLAQLAARAAAGDPNLSAEELAYLQANQARLTPEIIALLQAPSIPYNLDAWDGYAAERQRVFNIAQAVNANLISLAGDTHNAWANQLNNPHGEPIGVEFATPSVSSPGLASALNIPEQAYDATEAGIVSLIENLHYTNVGNRGLLVLDIQHSQLTANWIFVNTVTEANYQVLNERSASFTVQANNNQLQANT